MDAYSALAKYYDRLMEYPYDKVADLFFVNGAGRRALDLFCGTGAFTCRLAERGFNVQGSDLSREMLNVAVSTSKSKGYSIVFKKENALRFSYAKPFDVITAVSDGVNYIRPTDLNAFFERVANALVVGGRFVFDMSTEYKLKSVLGNNVFFEDSEDLVYYWRNTYKEREGAVKMDLTFFEKSGETYIRSDESQKQYAHKKEAIKILAEGYGMEIRACLDLDTFGAPHSRSKRILFELVKKG